MTDVATEAPSGERKGKLVPAVLSLFLALGGGAGGYVLVASGFLTAHAEKAEDIAPIDAPAVAFVPVDPIVVSLGPASTSRHLSFRAQLEVPAAHAETVAGMMPRVVDVLNGYLRAVDVREFEDPTALPRLRTQMLRRVRVMVGEERVRDLLVMEFVLD